jgi:hypothetical protein
MSAYSPRNETGLAFLFLLLLISVARADCPSQWTGWSAIPGGGITERAPAVVNTNDGIVVFALNGSDIIANRMSLSSDSWSGWEQVPSGRIRDPRRPRKADPFRTDQAVAGAVFGSGLYLFSKGRDDNGIYVNVMNLQDGTWDGWRTVPGSGSTDRPLAVTPASGALYLFLKGMDQHVYFNALPINTGNWTGWQEVPGGGTTDAPLAASASANRLYLFQKGLNQSIYVNRLEIGGGQWSGPREIPGGSITDMGLGSSIADDTLYLVGHGINDGHQYLNRMKLTDESWSGWSSVGGGGITDDVTAVAAVTSRVFILAKGTNVRQIYVNVLSADIDCDGVADSLEKELLARFRPYYRFSLDDGPDQYHPADALWYVRNSALLDAKAQGSNQMIARSVLATTPEKVLDVYTNIWGWSDRRKGPNSVTQYQLDIDDNLRTGEPDFEKVKSSAVGLYGHVAPLHEQASDPGLLTGFKIEYWQFYAFNDAPTDEYRHEGDWETVQLVIGPDGSTIRKIIHEVHGEPIVFVVGRGRRVDIGGGFLEYRGPQYGTVFWGPSGSGRAQNNLVRVFCLQGSCTHPVVYIEHSGHATWPSARWGWVGARKHEGNGEHYLVTTPPNLGEIGAANPDCPGSDIILHFNGHWGAKNDGPEGPAMKGSWGTP